MEITVSTVKLTKSRANQMYGASLDVMIKGKVLGHVVNVVKGSYKTAIIQHEDDYYIMPLNWTRGDLKVYRKVGKFTASKSFETSEEIANWWHFYTKTLNEALKTHIYI